MLSDTDRRPCHKIGKNPPPLIASEETPRRQPTNAHLPTHNRPRFVPPPRKRPDEGTTADNTPIVLRRLADRNR